MQEEQARSSAGPGGPDRLTTIRARIDELASLNRQLESARATGRRVRIVIVLIILLVVGGYTLTVYNAVKKFDQESSRRRLRPGRSTAAGDYGRPRRDASEAAPGVPG